MKCQFLEEINNSRVGAEDPDGTHPTWAKKEAIAKMK